MEILRIKSGSFRIEYGNNSAVLSKGDLVILPPKMLHKGYTIDEAVEYDVVMFDVRSFYNETELCKFLLPAIFDGRAIFKNITNDYETINCFDEISNAAETDSLMITSNIYRLIYLFYKNCLLELRDQGANSSIKEITDYIEAHYREDITTASLSEIFGYTSAHFCRKFKKATGLSPVTYLKIYRLEKASKILKTKEKRIGEIAAMCGFTDANYFTRCFKEHFGVSPSQYNEKTA